MMATRALAVAREFLPDVILLDLMMPGMSGREVAAALRQDGAVAGADRRRVGIR